VDSRQNPLAVSPDPDAGRIGLSCEDYTHLRPGTICAPLGRLQGEATYDYGSLAVHPNLNVFLVVYFPSKEAG